MDVRKIASIVEDDRNDISGADEGLYSWSASIRRILKTDDLTDSLMCRLQRQQQNVQTNHQQPHERNEPQQQGQTQHKQPERLRHSKKSKQKFKQNTKELSHLQNKDELIENDLSKVYSHFSGYEAKNLKIYIQPNTSNVGSSPGKNKSPLIVFCLLRVFGKSSDVSFPKVAWGKCLFYPHFLKCGPSGSTRGVCG